MPFVAPLLGDPAPWEALLESPLAALVCDENGQLLLCNDALLMMFGAPASELLGTGWATLLGVDVGPALLDRLGAEGLSRRRIFLPDGRPASRPRLVEAVTGRVPLAPAVERAGRPVAPGAMLSGLVIILEELPADAGPEETWAGVTIQIAPGDARVLEAGPPVRRYSGRRPAELVGRPVEEILAPASRAPFRAALAEAAQGVLRALDLVFVGESQRPHIIAALLRLEGTRVILHARDVTASRLVNELRTRAAQRAALDRLQSQFLATVSHELRTPLVSIKGYADLLLRGALGPLTDRQRRGLEIASANTDRLVELVEMLLDLSRGDEERLELHRAPFDLRAAVRDAVDGLGDKVAARGLTVRLELGDRPVIIDGDRARLAQVFRALLANAVKFTEGRRDGVDPDVTFTLRAEGDEAEVAVRDRGIGIPEGQIGRIFDRFYQVDGSSTRQFGGAGLGLALARELVARHGGDIRVDSVVGRGSTFTVRVPRMRAAEEGAETERPVVLLGADEARTPALRALLDEPRLQPLDVVVARSAGELLRRARRYRPDLVVLALPDLEGVTRELKRDPQTSERPVVVVARAGEAVTAAARADLVTALEERERLISGIARLLGREVAAPRPAEVVVVEDEVEILDFTRFILEREGYAVVGVGRGEEALDRVGPETGLVILDIALDGHGGEIDGIEVCKKLKSAPASHGVPVLIMTAMCGEDVRKVSLAAGADGYIVKPFGVEEFLRQVRLHLAPSPAAAPAAQRPAESRLDTAGKSA